MKILQLLPTFGYSSAAHQLSLLALDSASKLELQICVCDGLGPWAERFRQAGIPLHDLGWRRRVDLMPLWRLRRLIRRLQPQAVHVWGPRCLRALALAEPGYLHRTIVSHPIPSHLTKPRLGPLDRWLLRRVAHVAARCEAEADLVRAAGVPAEHVAIIPPGVAACLDSAPVTPPWPNPGMRTMVCFGPIERWKGFYHAIWAADFLNYAFPDTQMVIVGDGPDIPRLKWFLATGVYRPHRILFAGAVADPAPYLKAALVCWAPAETWAGMPAALEAQAAGCPVVAARTPLLASIIRDGETGYLATPGTKNELMRQTRRFLLDDGLRTRMGDAARRRIQADFSAHVFTARYGALYAGTVGGYLRAS